MSIKKLYYYFFYKLYKFWDYVSYPKFWSDFKAGISIVALEIWLITSIINYYNIFINRYFHLERNLFLLIATVIIISNYILFNYLNIWRNYNEEFDKWPRKKNVTGGIIVWSIIVFIVANLIFSFYLKLQIDWSQYR